MTNNDIIDRIARIFDELKRNGSSFDSIRPEIERLLNDIASSSLNGSLSGSNTQNLRSIEDLGGKLRKIQEEVNKAIKDGEKDTEKLVNLFEEKLKDQGLITKETEKEMKAVETVRKYKEDIQDIEYNRIRSQMDINANVEKEKKHWQTMNQIREINKRLAAGVNVEDEKALRNAEKMNHVLDLQTKKIREGLSATEELEVKFANLGQKINFDKIKNGFSEIKKGANEIAVAFKSFYEPWSKVDQAAADYTKRLGGTAQGLVNFRKETINAQTMRRMGSRYNVSMEELAKMQSDYSANNGRKIAMTNGERENMAATHALAGENGEAIVQNLENYGFDVNKGSDLIAKMFKSASKKGLAFEKVAQNFQENIKMAQSYTFADGIRGVERMAERSAALKLNMQQTSAFAEKVSTLEGAMQAGAGLSVLGGSFARNSNPLAMMYEGLNDAEGLQERTIRMIEGLGHFDKTKNQLDVSAFNRMRIKAMAQQTGMDYNNLMESANAMGRRKEVETQIRGLYGGDKELAELVKNTAQLDEKGNAYVTIEGEKKSVKDLTAADKGALKVNSNTQEDNIRDIAQNLRGMRETVEGIGKQRDGLFARMFEHIGEPVKDLVKWFGDSNPLIALSSAVPKLLGAILGGVTTIDNILLVKNGLFGGGGASFAKANVAGGGHVPYTIGKNGQVYMKGHKGSLGKASTFFQNQGTATATKTKLGGWKGLGVSAGLGLAGMGVNYLTDKAHENGERKGWGYGLGKTAGTALEWAGIGGAIGSIIPGIGTGIGAAIGGLAGAVYGGYQGFTAKALDDKKAAIEAQTGYWLNGEYTSDELDAILNHNVSGVLRSKMADNGDTIPGYRRGGIVRKNFKKGTNSVVGPGTSTSDSVPAMLSAGEGVVSADNMKGNKLTISAINSGDKMDGGLMNIKKVAHTESAANSIPKNITFSPMKIDVSGTIKLDLGGQTANIDVNKLVNDQHFINEISKHITAQVEYGFRKESAPVKYGYTNKR